MPFKPSLLFSQERAWASLLNLGIAGWLLIFGCFTHARAVRFFIAAREARAVAEAAADAARGPPPEPQRAFRLPMSAVPDLLMVWEFTQVGCWCDLLLLSFFALLAVLFCSVGRCKVAKPAMCAVNVPAAFWRFCSEKGGGGFLGRTEARRSMA
jgi:hypothetical protein